MRGIALKPGTWHFTIRPQLLILKILKSSIGILKRMQGIALKPGHLAFHHLLILQQPFTITIKRQLIGNLQRACIQLQLEDIKVRR